MTTAAQIPGFKEQASEQLSTHQSSRLCAYLALANNWYATLDRTLPGLGKVDLMTKICERKIVRSTFRLKACQPSRRWWWWR